MSTSPRQPDISLYDKHGYDYSTYWKNRQYEHEAETLALTSIFSNASGAWFVDIGGSFGRHIPTYKHKFQNCILLDYSINSLKKAADYIKKNNMTNIHLVAGNVYNLPFAADVIDSSMMIRVIHHLEEPEHFMKEVARITKRGGTFVLEYPNKNHLKSVIRDILKLNFSSLFSVEPKQVPFENPEGTTRKEPGIMLNFHPKAVERMLSDQGFIVNRFVCISFLRIPLLKRKLSTRTLLTVERAFQKFLSWTKLTPSIILETRKGDSDTIEQQPDGIESVLACPHCKKTMKIKGDIARCTKCGKTYKKTQNIWDLRYPLLT